MASQLSEEGCSRDEIRHYIQQTIQAMEEGTSPHTEHRWWTRVVDALRPPITHLIW